MLEPIDIATEIHKICEVNPNSPGISKPHDISLHSLTTAIYAKHINDGGLGHSTGKQAAEAILEASGWDLKGPWPGHPAPEKVIAALRKKI